MRTRIYLITTIILFFAAVIAPIFGGTWISWILFSIGFGSACAYIGRVEDTIHSHGRPVFW